MPALISISQATGPASSGAGFAYTGGVLNQLVTVTSAGTATTHEARLLIRPTDDVITLAQTGATTWTFTPNPSGGIPTGGATYRIELVTDRGLPSEDKQIRVFGIRDTNSLLIPPFGTQADPLANIPDLTDSILFNRYLKASELNEPDASYPNGNPFGWEKELKAVLQAGAGGGSSGDPAVIWEWDGTLDQFTNGGTPELDGSGGATLSLVTDQYDNPVLRATCGGTFAMSQWVIDPAQFPVLPMRYRIEWDLIAAENGLGAAGATANLGPTLFCQYNGPGDVQAYSLCPYANTVNASLQVWARGGTMAASGATPGGVSVGTNFDTQGMQTRMTVSSKVGTPFQLRYLLWGVKDNFDTRDVQNDVTLDMDGTRFDARVPNTFGIAARWNANRAETIDIENFRILKHPMDIA